MTLSDGKSEVVKVPRIATRSLWILGFSIILVLYVHTSLAPALTQMVEFFHTDYGVVSCGYTVNSIIVIVM